MDNPQKAESKADLLNSAEAVASIFSISSEDALNPKPAEEEAQQDDSQEEFENTEEVIEDEETGGSEEDEETEQEEEDVESEQPAEQPAELVQENADLRAQIAELTKLLKQRLESEQKPDDATPPPPAAFEPKLLPPVDFVKGSKLADTFNEDDVIAFNEVLNTVYSEAYNSIYQQMMTNLPSVVRANIQQVDDAKAKAQAFWQRNKDLLAGADTRERKQAIEALVAERANVISSKNPKLSFDEIADAAATEVRQLLGKPKAQRAPKFPAGTGGATAKKLANQDKLKKDLTNPNSATTIASIFNL